VLNVNVRGGSGDSGSAELGTKASLSVVPSLDLKTSTGKVTERTVGLADIYCKTLNGVLR